MVKAEAARAEAPPAAEAEPEAEPMVKLLATTAKREDVDLFRRYDVMKRWNEIDHLNFDIIAAPDGLHLNDWSYACMAKGLALAIADAATRPVLSAKVTPTLMPDVP